MIVKQNAQHEKEIITSQCQQIDKIANPGKLKVTEIH